MKFSVTSVMIPELDLRETVELLAGLGFQGVEWRARRIPEEKRNQKYSFWGNHKNDLTPERFLKEAKEIRKLCDDHNLRIVALAPQARADELEEVKLLADAAAEASYGASRGTREVGEGIMVRIGAPRSYNGKVPYPVLYQEAVEAYGKALEITRSRRIKVIVELHMGTITVSASFGHRLVSNFSPLDIGIIYDVNNMIVDGLETPQMGLELLGPYLAHVHMAAHRPLPGDRDAQGAIAWRWEGCPLSDGLLHMPKFFATLATVNYQGFCSLEDFRAGNAKEKLTESMNYLKAIGVTEGPLPSTRKTVS